MGQQLSQCDDVRDRDDGDAARVVPGAGRRARRRPTPTSRSCAQLYPDVYTTDGGFYDAVNPSTGAVGHRRLVLDQSMIMAALDNALNNRQLQRWFAMDPTANAARQVLQAEHMSI